MAFECLVEVVGLLLVDAGQAQQHFGLQSTVQDAVDLGVVHRCQIGPAAARLGQAVDVGNHVLVRRIHPQGATVGIKRPIEIVQTVLVKLRQQVEQLDPTHRLLHVGNHDLVDGCHLAPVARTFEDGQQHLGRRNGLFPSLHHALKSLQGRLVRGVHGEHALVGFRGPARILELVRPQLTDAVAQRNHLG